MGRAHNQAVNMNDKKVASELQQSKWASVFYQMMLSRRDIATTSKFKNQCHAVRANQNNYFKKQESSRHHRITM
jgi:hypothetical protein